jgi:Concanavalin A-like lectin/glucanases superfamily/FecR protein
MNDPISRSDELEILLSALCDGQIREEQLVRLNELLRSDESLRRHYLRYIGLHTALQGRIAVADPVRPSAIPDLPGRTVGPPEEARAAATPPTLPAPGVLPIRSRPPRLAAIAAVAAVLLGLIFVSRPSWPRRTPSPRPPAPAATVARATRDAAPRPVGGGASAAGATDRAVAAGMEPRAGGGGQDVAVLTRVVDAEWGPTELPTAVGSALPTGRLRLNSGLIQLEFYGGAIVVLEGPADLDLIAADRVFCRRGKLRARMPLKKSTRFTIGTPDTDVVDLGTEFGVLVDEKGGSEVQVFEGSVELKRKGPARTAGRLLTTGERVRIDPTGASRAAETDPRSFVGTREVQRRASTEAGQRYRAWLDLSRKLQADPRVLVYYSFEGQQPWERTLLDRAVGRGTERNGGIVGCEWTEGRWPGKAALDFKRASDRVLVDIPGELRSLTLMTWVRVDDYDNRLSALLLSDGWEQPGELHWEFDGKGTLIFAVKNEGQYNSPVVLGASQLGLWTHLATVYAPTQRSLTHYVNGRAVKSYKLSEDSRTFIGNASIGNYHKQVRNLNGRIDEFLIFDQALDAPEIRAIYEVGKPSS